MRSHPSILQFYVCILLALVGFARAQHSNPTQTPVKPPARLISPEVHADGSVIFRFRAPHAQEVKLAREGAQPVAMEKDEQGVWSVTTAALPPDYYGYSLIADGVHLIDPSNPLLKPNLLATENMVHVPGPAVGREARLRRRFDGCDAVVYGHTPVPEPEWLNRTINIDTGCVFGGRLTALCWPEKELVSVAARETYADLMVK